MEYTDKDRRKDFDWFIENYQNLFDVYGYSYIAIRNKTILGSYKTVREALNTISLPAGAYIVQLCNGDESGYTNYVASNQVCVI